jgi:diguanylate cyclase (GGDEF)-like protein/PAS domain S-box-containing protein
MLLCKLLVESGLQMYYSESIRKMIASDQGWQVMHLKLYQLKVFLISVTAMTAYETLGELFFLNISRWQSHVITILVVSCGVMLASYFFDKKVRALWPVTTVFDTLDDAVMITDHDNCIIALNPAFTKITGDSPDEVLGKNPKMLSHSKHQPEFYTKLWNILTTTGDLDGEIWNRHKDGEIFVEWLSIKRIYNESGRLSHHVWVFSDLSEHKASSKRIQHLAHHDILTDLPNRILFNDHLYQAIANARREHKRTALLSLNLDNFIPISNKYGLDIGDLLLKEVSIRLLNCARRGSDTVARIEGDKFFVLLAVIQQTKDAISVAENIRYILNQTFEIAGQSIHISSSIGIAVFPDHGSDENLLLKNADIAMDNAKIKGGNGVQIYQSII